MKREVKGSRRKRRRRGEVELLLFLMFWAFAEIQEFCIFPLGVRGRNCFEKNTLKHQKSNIVPLGVREELGLNHLETTN